MENKKTAGKFAWFCIGSILGMKGVPKLAHLVYWIIIIILASAAYTNVVPLLLGK